RPVFGMSEIISAAGIAVKLFMGHYTSNIILSILQNSRPGGTGNTSQMLPFLEGPASLGLDVALSKRVRIREVMTFTIRVDAINVLNTPQWGDPQHRYQLHELRPNHWRSRVWTITIDVRVDF